MEEPRKHDNKNNNNTVRLPINIGAGSFGIGGIVLLGGAFVTATLVSALAIKTRRQRPSSSHSINKQTVDELELMLKINKDRESTKDFSVDSSPVDLRNPSSDEVNNMKEMQTKPNQSFIPDENVDSGDGNEDVTFAVVGQHQENTSIYVNSVSEREQLDNGCEKTLVDESKEQVVVTAPAEVRFQWSEEESHNRTSVISAPKDDGGRELIDDENDEQMDTGTEKPLVSNQALTSIEEDEAIEGVVEVDQAAVEEEESVHCEKARDITVEVAPVQVPLGDDVEGGGGGEEEEEGGEIPIGHVGEDHETVLMNEEAVQEDGMEAACVYQIEVEDNPQGQFLEVEREKDDHGEMVLENFEEEWINGTGSAHQIVIGQVMGKAATDAACVHLIEEEYGFLEEEKDKDSHDEIILENSEEYLLSETGFTDQIVSAQEAINAACVPQIEVDDSGQVQFLEEEREKESHDEIILQNSEGDSSNETGFADQIVRENQQTQYNSERAMGEAAAIESACVELENVEGISEMAHHGVALEDYHASEVREAFPSGEHSSTAVAYIMNSNESLKVAADDETGVKEDSPRRQLMNKEEYKETAQEIEQELITEEELVKKDKEDEIPHVQLTEVAKDDDQTAVREDNSPTQLMNNEKGIETAEEVQVKMRTEDELVNREDKGKEDEISHVQLTEEAKDDYLTAGREDDPKEEESEETAEEVQVEMITEDESVKKEEENKEDEIPHVKLIEEDEAAKGDEEDARMELEESLGDSSAESNGVAIWADESLLREWTPETKTSSQRIEESMEAIEGKEQNDNENVREEKGTKRFMMAHAKERKQEAASEAWKLKLGTWSVLVSIWCLCHWYSELPFPEVSVVGSLLFILFLLGTRNHTACLVKYE